MAHKLTQAQLIALAASVGVDVELVAEDSQSDFATGLNNDTLLQAVDKSREGIIGSKLKDSLNGEIYGTVTKKVNNSMRKAVAELLGVAESELTDKDAKEALTIGITAYGKKLEGDKSQTQAEIAKILDTHKAAMSAKETEWETKYNGKVAELTDREIMEHIMGAHKGAKGLPVGANVELLAKTFRSHLDGKAILKLEDGKLNLYRKDKPDMKLLNDAATQEVGVADFIKPFYTDLGLWREDNRDIKTPQPGVKTIEDVKTSDEGKSLSRREQMMATFSDDYGKTGS